MVLAIGGALTMEQRTSKREPSGELHGIDVSNHQGVIDWSRVADDNVDFVYVKATEGGDWIDERFHDNWDQADDAGIERGAYHFFTLCRLGADQAANFLATVPDDPEALPPAVDLELAGNCSARPPRAVVLRELRAFIDIVERETGRRVVLYLVDDFEQAFGVRATIDRHVWVPDLDSRPPEPWLIWQTTYSARVAGIHGDVDRNIMRFPAPT